jgi:hypothetical protein
VNKCHYAADGDMKALYKNTERIGGLILSAYAMMAVEAAKIKYSCL